MAKKPVDMIDRETGEVLQTGYLWYSNEPPKISGTRFFMVFQDAMTMLAKDPELTQQVQRVMLYMWGNLNFENFVHVKQADIARELNMPVPNVSRAISVLRRKEIILLAPEKGVRCYKLNHWVGWKGSVVNFNREVREEQRKLKLVKSDQSEKSA